MLREEFIPLELPIHVPVKGHTLAPPEFLVHDLGRPVGLDDHDPVLVLGPRIKGAVGFSWCHPIYSALAVIQGFEFAKHKGGVILGVLPETSGHIVGKKPYSRRVWHLPDLFGLYRSQVLQVPQGGSRNQVGQGRNRSKHHHYLGGVFISYPPEVSTENRTDHYHDEERPVYVQGHHQAVEDRRHQPRKEQDYDQPYHQAHSPNRR